MRRTLHRQAFLFPVQIEHEHARELEVMSRVLDECPEALEWVHADLVEGVRADTGQEGLSADQVLRAGIVKQMNGFSYEVLAFHLADSSSYRWFCRLPSGKSPSKTALHRDLKRVRPQTWEAINRKVVERAQRMGLEDGRRVRVDCTVTETHIHRPTDSWLLLDCVRSLARNLVRARKVLDFRMRDHRRRAKRRALAIENVRGRQARQKLYRDLVKVTEKTMHYADGAVARLVEGEKVPSSEKIVSIFEPHTDIIVKDRRDTLYGHKLCLTIGASGLVLDGVIERGNTADATLATRMIERQTQLYERPPRQAAFDGAFASRANLDDIKKLGVDDVAFTKVSYLDVSEMVKSAWVYKRLRNFRAGIETYISFLKRCFGLRRCNWRGFASFKAYAWLSILSANLLIVARHVLH